MEKGANDIVSGWNGSGQKGAAPAQPKVTAKKPSPIRGLVAGGAVVALAVVAYFVFFSGSERQQDEKAEKERGRIKEVTPAAAPKAVEPEKPKKPKEDIRVLPDGKLMKYREDGTPAWAYPRKPVSAHPITNGLNRVKTLEEQVFKNPSDVEIAWLLNTDPGEQLVGDYDYSRHFEKRFLEAADKSIEISAEDSDEVKALKQAVIDARKDLMTRYKLGEDIAQVMADTRKELQEIGLYREELKEQVRKIAKENDGKFTEHDYEDCISAVNKMLEERGAKPIQMPAFIKYKIEQLREAQEEGGTEE